MLINIVNDLVIKNTDQYISRDLEEKMDSPPAFPG